MPCSGGQRAGWGHSAGSRGRASQWAGPPGGHGLPGGRGLRAGQEGSQACSGQGVAGGTHPAAGHVAAGHGPWDQHVDPALILAAVLSAVVHAAVDPGLVGLKRTGESGGVGGDHLVGRRAGRGSPGWGAETEPRLTWTSLPSGVRQAVGTHSPQHCPAARTYSEPWGSEGSGPQPQPALRPSCPLFHSPRAWQPP